MEQVKRAAGASRPGLLDLVALLLLAGAVTLESGGLEPTSSLPKQLALCGLAALLLARAEAAPGPRRAGDLDLLALGLWVTLAWATSLYRGPGLARLALWAAGLGAVSGIGRGRLPQRLLAGTLAALGVAVSAAGLLEQWLDLGLREAAPPAAWLGNRSTAAAFAAGCLPLLGAFGLGGRRGRLRSAPAGLAQVTLVAAFLVSTRGRAAWVAAAVGLLAALPWGRPRRPTAPRSAPVGLALALGLLLASALTPGPRLRWASPSPYADSARSLLRADLGGRPLTWANSLHLLAAHPLLGLGPASFRWAYAGAHRAEARDPSFSVGRQLEEPHAEWLRVALEAGLPALALSLLLLARSLGPRRRRSPRTAALQGSLLGLLVCSLSSQTLLDPPTLALSAAVLGLLRRARAGRAGARRGPGAARLAWALVALLLLARLTVGLVEGARWRRAEAELARGGLRPAAAQLARLAASSPDPRLCLRAALVNHQAGEEGACLAAAARAVELAPPNPAAQEALGLCAEAAGDWARAEPAFRAALAALPDDYVAWLRLGEHPGDPAGRRAALIAAVGGAAFDLEHLPPRLGQAQRERARQVLDRACAQLEAPRPGPCP